MKQAAVALRALITDGLGLEGFLLIVGTGVLAVGASYISPAGPWFVVGVASVVLGIALAVTPRRQTSPDVNLNDRLGIPNPPPEVL